MIDLIDWKWRGLPGHFCSADKCKFRLCTDIGKYRISTVGAMYINGILKDIGLENHYETMVFKLNKEGQIEEYIEIDGDKLYLGGKRKQSDESWDKKAEQMHITFCLKYAELQ